MALIQTNEARGIVTTPGPLTSGVTVATESEFTVPAGLAAGDVVEMLRLPAYCTVVDAILVTDDVDSNATPTLSLDVGFVSGEVGKKDNSRTCGNELFAADLTARSGGSARMSKASGFRIAKAEAERAIGMRVATGAATLVPGAKIKLIVFIKQ